MSDNTADDLSLASDLISECDEPGSTNNDVRDLMHRGGVEIVKLRAQLAEAEAKHEVATKALHKADMLHLADEQTIRNLRRERANQAELKDAKEIDMWSLCEKLREAEADSRRARETVAFFRSVIKSGESWTSHCEAAANAVLKQGQEEPGPQTHCAHGKDWYELCWDCRASAEALGREEKGDG